MRFGDNNKAASFGNDRVQGQLPRVGPVDLEPWDNDLTDVIEVLQNERSQVF